MSNNLNKYITIKTVPSPSEEEGERRHQQNMAGYKMPYYEVPKSMSEGKEEGASNYLSISWEDSQRLWNKVNSVITGFNNLLDNDKEITPVNHIIIVDGRRDKALSNMAILPPSTLYVNKNLIERWGIDSDEFTGLLKHEIAHHYDYVNNGKKEVVYDIKQHIKDSNPKLFKFLIEKNVTDREFHEASLERFGAMEHFIDLLNNRSESSVDYTSEIKNLWHMGNADEHSEKPVHFYIEHSNYISPMKDKLGQAISHQRELDADKFATILSKKNSPDSSNKAITTMDKLIEEGAHNLDDENNIDRHGHNHPNLVVRKKIMQEIINSSNIPTEDLMNLPSPFMPRRVFLPNNQELSDTPRR